MKKEIIILVILLIIGILSIIFFNHNSTNYYLDYANKIIALYQGNNNTEGIKKSDLEAFNNFYKSLKHEDEVIDITSYFAFDSAHKNSGEPYTKASYINNKCFIKYEDLTLWNNNENANEGEAIFQRVSCNGYETILFETMFMPSYDKIITNPKYIYVIDSYNENLSGYSFKYKSTYDNSSLTLKLIIEDNRIIEVKANYD